MPVNLSAFPIIFQALLVSLLTLLFLAWVSIHLAKKLCLMDTPHSEPHKLHDQPVPLAGGMALFATLVVVAWLFEGYSHVIYSTLLAGLPVFVFGLWDDFRPLKPFIKLTAQTAAALLVCWSGNYIRLFESPEFFISGTAPIYVWLDWLVTIFWIVGITNAFNFVDSMDGLVVGLGGIAAAFFLLVTLDAGQAVLSIYSAILLGICIGLYFYNSPPALLFLGDSGSQMLGFFLAVLAIAYTPQGAYQLSSWFVPILLLGVPIFDAALVIFSRLRGKRPVFQAARDHTYHRLWSWGLDLSRAVLVMQLAALILGCLAYISQSMSPFVANVIFASVLIVGASVLLYLDRQEYR